MAKFSALPAASTLDGTEITALVQSSTSKRSTAQDQANLYKGTKGADLASAATVTLANATGNTVHITGTTTITSFGNASAGLEREVIFDGILTLTHNATTLILPTGASITTAAGDSARFVCDTTNNWRCTKYQRANGQPLVGAAPANDAVTNAILANMATQTIKGRTTASTGDPEDLTAAQAAAVVQGDGTAADSAGFRGIPQASFSANTTIAATHGGKELFHPSSDANARTVTIDSNANLALPIGFTFSVVNDSANAVSVAITTDTMVMAGAGTTGTRSIAQYGAATFKKVATTRWYCFPGPGTT